MLDKWSPLRDNHSERCFSLPHRASDAVSRPFGKGGAAHSTHPRARRGLYIILCLVILYLLFSIVFISLSLLVPCCFLLLFISSREPEEAFSYCFFYNSFYIHFLLIIICIYCLFIMCCLFPREPEEARWRTYYYHYIYNYYYYHYHYYY